MKKTELNRNYDPSREDAIYQNWLEKNYFHAEPNPNKKPFTVMIPPPNITNILHIGHSLNNTIQDIIVRSKRMQGYEALWMPGTDHAAISTEVRIVQDMATEGLTKEDIGREKFLERAWAWNEKYGGSIIKQFKKMGFSCDWERTRFTMDKGLTDAVLEVFVRLYNEGKIYKGERLVNWCVKCQTSISDAEVEHEDKEGALYYFKYPIDGTDKFIDFGTTRPETMLGDTAIAVHPADERYALYIGMNALIPANGRLIPIITDEYVDPKYGTGVVKITPAHDPNDFEVGERHKLPRINILNDDGTINANGGKYEGMTREAAREAITKEMDALGYYIKTEKLTHAVGTHDRCHEVVEPILKLQWFVKMKELAQPALDAYTGGKLRFNRERFGKVYAHWLENIKDWCISRQLWWGHRIPAYYCANGHTTVSKTNVEVCPVCGDTHVHQDEDTLDTWFSSALWPFSTLGWPGKTEELKYFYPTNVLVTAPEIIFFWVARMVFSGIKFMGEIPFTDVFIHGMVRADDGRKMSKSLGNGVDPLVCIEQYGADALRLMLVSGNALDNDTRFYESRLDVSRNFINKLWNATRFILMNADENDSAGERIASDESGNANERIASPKSEPGAALNVTDRWILSRANSLVKEVTEKLDEYELGLAAQKIVDFVWDELCDWYVEIVKPRLYGKETQESRARALDTLQKVLITSVKLLHPFIPFVTEDLFMALQDGEETVMLSPWPLYDPALEDPAAEKSMERVKETVRGIRNIRTEKQVPPPQKIKITVLPNDAEAAELFNQGKSYIAFLAGASEVLALAPGTKDSSMEKTVTIVVDGAVLYLPLSDLVDTEKEKTRLGKEKQKLLQEIARVDGKLNNEGFMAKAPEKLVAEEREKREKYREMLSKVEAQLTEMV